MGHVCYFSVTRENTVEALKAAADADALVPAGQSVQAAADGLLDTIWPEDEPAPWLWAVTPAAAGLLPRCRIRMRAVGEAGAVTEYATDLTAEPRHLVIDGIAHEVAAVQFALARPAAGPLRPGGAAVSYIEARLLLPAPVRTTAIVDA